MKTNAFLRLTKIITQKAGEFIEQESSGLSLITVTECRLSEDGKRVIILVSVIPETKSEAALDFLKRQRSTFRTRLMKETKIARVPSIDFELDRGEKNRQRIEELSKKIEI